MKLIYKAWDVTEAHIISGLLKSYGIDSHVGGHYLQGGIGDLAAMDFATISVADENVDSAITIISEYEKSNIQPRKIDKKSKSIFTGLLIFIVISVIMFLLLTIVFGDYK